MAIHVGILLAQESVRTSDIADIDSLTLPFMKPVPSGMGTGVVSAFPEFKLRRPLTRYSQPSYVVSHYELNRKFNFQQYAPKDYLLRWDEGRLTGYNSTELLPGIGGVATAGVTAVHHFSDELTLTGGAMLQKTGLLYNTASVHAQLSYQLTDYVSVNAFGAYQSPSFMSTYHTRQNVLFGGFVTLHTENKKWGVDLGEKTEVNPYTGRLEATPIVMPYYNLQGQKLGIDFGGLLKSIIINNRMRKEGAPPMGPMGPMGPIPPMPH
jgi:hypothetical protein